MLPAWRQGRTRQPVRVKVARLKAALLEAGGWQDVRDVVATLTQNAKNGDPAAAKGLLDRMFGPPKDSPEEPPVDVEALFMHHFRDISGLARRQIRQVLLDEVKRNAEAKAIPRPE